MSIEKERLTGNNVPIWVRNEHLVRYRYAATRAHGKTVIDCACGDGRASRMMAEAGAAHVYGFDLSAEAIDYARRLNNLASTQFEIADGSALPLEDESADLFVSLETIEHVDAVDMFLGEVVRVLRSDGEFVCSTPNRIVYSPGHTLESRPWNRFHVREYSREELNQLLGSYFEEVRLLGQNLRPKRQVARLDLIGRHMPFDLAVRARQVAKLPRFLYDKEKHHAVVALDDRHEPEALVAVCSAPRTRTGTLRGRKSAQGLAEQ